MCAAGTDRPAVVARQRVARALRGLYAITPDLADTRLLVARVEAAIAGGAAAIQYRNKTANVALRREQALALTRACAVHGVPLIVNDDPALARDVHAAGVHVGEDDAALAAARSAVGETLLIGVSCYGDFARAEQVAAAGADYVAFGSFFSSSVKPAARRADLALLDRARSLPVPVVAIGGITAGNAGALAKAGADAVAVITGVFGHDDLADVTRAAAEIVRSFDINSIRSRKP